MNQLVLFGILICSLDVHEAKLQGGGTLRGYTLQDGSRSNTPLKTHKYGYTPKIGGTITAQYEESLLGSTLHMSPWDFYTEKHLSNNNIISRQTFQMSAEDGSVPEITDQVETMEPQLCRQDKVTSSNASSVFHQLNCIIHKPDFHKTDFDLVGRDYSGTLQSQLLDEGSFLEIGSGVTTLALSRSNYTLAALIYPEYQMAEKVLLSKKSNTPLMALPLAMLLATIDRFQSDPQVTFTSIFLSNITALVSNHLPDELELLLAKVFSLSQKTYIAFDKWQDHKMESFFSYWDSPEHLLENACKTSLLSCLVQHEPSSSANWEKSFWRVVVTKAVRKMSRDVCEGHWQCSMVYKNNNGTKRQWLEAHDWKAIITIPSCGFSLHTLLQLGLIVQSREHLMTPLLEANLNPYSVTARDLCVSKQGIRLMPKDVKILKNAKKDVLMKQLALMDKILQTTETKTSVSLNQQPFKIHGLLEPPMSRIDQPKTFEKSTYESDKDRKGDNFLKRQNNHDPHLKNEPRNTAHFKIQEPHRIQPGLDSRLEAANNVGHRIEQDAETVLVQETNQEDGVAHLWHREMGVIEDDDRENLKRGALVKMSEQWDRENQQVDNDGDIMSDQYKWAAIEKLWIRDEDDDTDSIIASREDARAGIPDGHAYNNKYDKELGKMIGSLNDNIDPVGKETDKHQLGKQGEKIISTKDRGMKAVSLKLNVEDGIASLEKSKEETHAVDSQGDVLFKTKTATSIKRENMQSKPITNVGSKLDHAIPHTSASQTKLKKESIYVHQSDNAKEQQKINKGQHAEAKRKSLPAVLTNNKLNMQNLQERTFIEESHQAEVLQNDLLLVRDKDVYEIKDANVEALGKQERQVHSALNDHHGEISGTKLTKRHLLQYEEAKMGGFYTTHDTVAEEKDKLLLPPLETTEDLQPPKDEVVEESDYTPLINDKELSTPPVSEEVDDDEQVDSDQSQSEADDDTLGDRLDRRSLYTAEWTELQQQLFQQKVKRDEPFNLLTYGLEQQSSLGAKICRLYPNASVVTIIPQSEEQLISHHRKLQESMELKNNILISTDLPDKMVFSLYRLPELFKFQILGLSVFNKAASLGGLFPRYLGRLLFLAETTFLEVPPPHSLALAAILLGQYTKQNEISVFKGFIHRALEIVGVKKSQIELLGSQMPNSIRFVKVHLLEGAREVKQDCSNIMKWLHLHEDKPTLNSAVSLEGSPLYRAMKAISLKTLLTFGLPSLERKKLFFQYFKIELHSSMCPTNIVWMQGNLVYNPVLEMLPTNVDDKYKTATLKGIMGLLSSQLDSEPFSFLEYGSTKGSLSLALAAKYSNSSIISMADYMSDAKEHYREVKKRGLWNNAITVLRLDEEFSKKLVGSPDFLRYQFMNMYQYLLLLQEQGATLSDKLATLMGNLLSSAVTTFIQLPSSQALSLAMATFFPEILNSTKFVHMTQQEKFLRGSHPLGPYRNAEIHLIKEESLGPSVNVNVSSRVLHPEDESLTWSLLRVDVRNLTITVNHHFDYSRDGHSRKYILHCNSNKTNYDVYLIRKHDGFRIPYGKISAFSLIALLRMELLEEMKDRFYNLFLNLPLYEDMAPWNIVFQGGKLQYIDFDTKDYTFDKVAPMAYQVMALLMNYESTVKQFGRCRFNAGNPYGFTYISHCVGSKYTGPCTDSNYPVPCADHTCKATYIDCLKALSDTEQGLTESLKGTGKADAGMMDVENTNLTSEYSQINDEQDWQIKVKS